MAPRSDASRKLTRAFRRVHIVHMAARLPPGPFTVDSYRRLAELGILHQDDRVELVAGQVVELTPIGAILEIGTAAVLVGDLPHGVLGMVVEWVAFIARNSKTIGIALARG